MSTHAIPMTADIGSVSKTRQPEDVISEDPSIPKTVLEDNLMQERESHESEL
jgi:hypothetical protein